MSKRGRTFAGPRGYVRLLIAVALLAGLFAAIAQPSSSPLLKSFQSPPPETRPWVYWFWVDGNVTREGITADLEAIARVGIGGVLLMDVVQGFPQGPVAFNSPEWRELFTHAALEATRLGLKINLHNSAGYTGSGGPWITPGLAMQKLVFSVTNITGPAKLTGLLPPPGKAATVAILAYPTPPCENAALARFSPEMTSNDAKTKDLQKLLDENPKTSAAIGVPRFWGDPFILLRFQSPFTASRLMLENGDPHQNYQGLLEVSDDGKTFRPVREFLSGGGDLSLDFPIMTARYYRLRFTKVVSTKRELRFAELRLFPVYRLDGFSTKAGMGRMNERMIQSVSSFTVPPDAAIQPGSIIDLTPLLRADVTDKSPVASEELSARTWEVPQGTWTVLRIGYAPTGRTNHPADTGGLGLECDKLSKEAVTTHYNSFVKPVLEQVRKAGASAVTGVHIDSWEVGFQNWTREFIAEFQKRRGYDPLPYLPACSGRIVGSVEISERFLWDFRRTIADLLADNYAGQLAALARDSGVEFSVEAYSNGPFDDLQYATRADIPMTEFWVGDPAIDAKPMPSAAHIMGRKIVAAESFTAFPEHSKWRNHPAVLKPLADAVFCEGVNRLVFHRFAHQPWTNVAPGMTMGAWGTEYDRTLTWWEQSAAWHGYLARCQFLLQSGRFVADVCYMTEEGAFCQPPGRAQLNPTLPQGYDYDLVTPELVLNRARVESGKVVFSDGPSYSVLVLPQSRVFTPAILRKIIDLARSGATVMASTAPARSPSLSGFPKCDDEVRQLAAELWGECDGEKVTEHLLGKGRLTCGRPLAQVLTEAGLQPDIACKPAQTLRWIHRRIDGRSSGGASRSDAEAPSGADIYFLVNPATNAFRGECEFRVFNRAPQLWKPDSGRASVPRVWQAGPVSTRATIELGPKDSVFVVFQDGVTNLAPAPEPRLLDLQVVTGDWELTFPPDRGAPPTVKLSTLQSWSAHPEPGVRFFSGTATYRKQLTIPEPWVGGDQQILLDLGHVDVTAQVELNGRDLGILWKAPFEVDISDAARAGLNDLKIKVTNLWPNRLIGDEHLPEDVSWRAEQAGMVVDRWPEWLAQTNSRSSGRIAFTTWKPYGKESPLLSSGLLGPVRLRHLAR